MNKITNSIIKEQMRQRNESSAENYEQQIQAQVMYDISQLLPRNKYKVKLFLIIGGVVGILLIFALSWPGILVGPVLGLSVWLGMNLRVSSYNKKLEALKNHMRQDAQRKIAEAYAIADQRTAQQIGEYDAEVRAYSQKILQNAEKITPMVEHVTKMFQRMISHADSGAHIRFVEANFSFQVNMTGINYNYQSSYTNPQDDYNFNKERYRDLKSIAECEGLAQALVKLTVAKMKSLYPANAISMTVTHIDAKVAIYFRGANANFMPARDIL